MDAPFLLFWTVMIFASIAWYALLVFLVGVRGGRDIRRMIAELERKADRSDKTRG